VVGTMTATRSPGRRLERDTRFHSEPILACASPTPAAAILCWA